MSLPSVRLQPPSVDFIDNCVQTFHDAFKNPQSRFDAVLGRYIPLRMNDSEAPSELRQGQPVKSSMAFWEPLYPKAMTRLKELHPAEPKDRIKSGHDYGIRTAGSWPTVYNQLQKAREVYDGKAKGLWGRRYKKALRWIADHAAPASGYIKYVPNIDYVSPVLAAVGVVLDVSNDCKMRGSKECLADLVG